MGSRVPRRIRPLFEDGGDGTYFIKDKWYDVVRMDDGWITFINEYGTPDGFSTLHVFSNKFEVEYEEDIIDKILLKYNEV